MPRKPEHQRHIYLLAIQRLSVIGDAVLSQRFAMVRCNNHECVFQQSLFVQLLQQVAKGVVGVLDSIVVFVDYICSRACAAPRSAVRNWSAIPMVNVEVIQERKERPLIRNRSTSRFTSGARLRTPCVPPGAAPSSSLSSRDSHPSQRIRRRGPLRSLRVK